MRVFVIKKRQGIIVLLGIIIVVLLILSLLINRTEEVFKDEVYYKGTKDENIVSFLCNIDWGNEHIPEMLRIFDQHSIKITFSITGRWAKENPDIVKSIYDSNHEIANHGYNHVDHNKLNYEDNYQAISKASEVLEEIIGQSPKYFGPPSGAFNEATVRSARDLGYTMIMWSVDTIDWREGSTKDVIIERVTKDINPSDIILMHPKEETVKALPEIIEFLFEKGYKIGTISDVLN